MNEEIINKLSNELNIKDLLPDTSAYLLKHSEEANEND